MTDYCGNLGNKIFLIPQNDIRLFPKPGDFFVCQTQAPMVGRGVSNRRRLVRHLGMRLQV